MPIDNPVAVRFCNEQIRTAADTIAGAAGDAKAILAAWQAQGIANLVPDDPANMLADGSPADGRPPASGADIRRIIDALTAIAATFDQAASNGQSHVMNALKIAPNPRRRT